MMNLRSFQILALSIALSAAGVGCKKKAPDSAGPSDNAAATQSATIKIGEVGSMTGQQATFGQSTHNGIMMAVEELNAAGGIKGKKVEILYLKHDETNIKINSKISLYLLPFIFLFLTPLTVATVSVITYFVVK